jgi:hypothetical protein
MPENSQTPTPAPPEVSDAPLKRMIVLSTALSLGLAYGWLAGFVRQPNGDLAFQWRWLVLLWAVIGFASTAFFWRKVWPPPRRPDATRKDIVLGSIVLALPGLWWLIFPLRSLSGQHFWQVVLGLSIAAVVLSFAAFMVIRLGKAFEGDGDKGS